MGLALKTLYATNIENDGKIFLSGWKPEFKDGKYYWPANTPIGHDMYIDNVMDLKEDEGTIPVEIIESEQETGLWLICYDDFFGGEQHLCNFKPRFIEGTKKYDSAYEDEIWDKDEKAWSLHVDTEIKMETGDGPIPVTLKRK